MSASLTHIARLLRYGSVGIAVSLLYGGLVVGAMDALGVHSPTLVSSLAFLLVLPVSFLGHRMVSFHDANPDPRQSYRFGAIAIVSFVFAVGGMRLMTEVWKLHYVFGILIAWVLVPAANFVINSLWVFPLAPPTSAVKIEDENKRRHEGGL